MRNLGIFFFALPLFGCDKHAELQVLTNVTSAQVGSEIELRVHAKDLRNPAEGVYAGYVNVTTSGGTVEVLGPIDNKAPFNSVTSGHTDEPGFLLKDAGAASINSNPTHPNPTQLFSLRVKPTTAGKLCFHITASDTPGHGTLLYGENTAVTSSKIELTGRCLDVS